MTAIVAVIEDGKVNVGGDSIGVNVESLSVNVRKDEKVFINGNFVVGFAGSYRMGSILRYSFKPPAQPQGMADDVFMNTVFVDSIREALKVGGYAINQGGRESAGKFLVGYKGKIYIIDSDYQVGIPVDPFAAIGSGADLCLGSLCSTKGKTPKERINMALGAAERYNAGVRKPFNIKVM